MLLRISDYFHKMNSKLTEGFKTSLVSRDYGLDFGLDFSSTNLHLHDNDTIKLFFLYVSDIISPFLAVNSVKTP